MLDGNHKSPENDNSNFNIINKEDMILNYLSKNNKISTPIAIELIGFKATATKSLLKTMVAKGLLKAEGNGKARCYILK